MPERVNQNSHRLFVALAVSGAGHALALALLAGSYRFLPQWGAAHAPLVVRLEPVGGDPAAAHALPPRKVARGFSPPALGRAAEPGSAPSVPAGPPTAQSGEALPAFSAELRAAIEREKDYPATARARRQQGRVQVGFTLTKQGDVRDIHLVEASPHALLNEAALATLRRLGHFKPIPDSVSPGDWNVIVPIDFRLD